MGYNESNNYDSRHNKGINMSERVNKTKLNNDEYAHDNNVRIESDSTQKWRGVNALLETAGLDTLPVQYQGGAVSVNPDKICEAIIHLTNKNKTWQKKLSEIEQINQGLTNQLKHMQSKN